VLPEKDESKKRHWNPRTERRPEGGRRVEVRSWSRPPAPRAYRVLVL
jgi:predicted alpha/beta hydrolase family esterase